MDFHWRIDWCNEKENFTTLKISNAREMFFVFFLADVFSYYETKKGSIKTHKIFRRLSNALRYICNANRNISSGGKFIYMTSFLSLSILTPQFEY